MQLRQLTPMQEITRNIVLKAAPLALEGTGHKGSIRVPRYNWPRQGAPLLGIVTDRFDGSDWRADTAHIKPVGEDPGEGVRVRFDLLRGEFGTDDFERRFLTITVCVDVVLGEPRDAKVS